MPCHECAVCEAPSGSYGNDNVFTAWSNVFMHGKVTS